MQAKKRISDTDGFLFVCCKNFKTHSSELKNANKRISDDEDTWGLLQSIFACDQNLKCTATNEHTEEF
jgi:hypothetical protein